MSLFEVHTFIIQMLYVGNDLLFESFLLKVLSKQNIFLLEYIFKTEQLLVYSHSNNVYSREPRKRWSIIQMFFGRLLKLRTIIFFLL